MATDDRGASHWAAIYDRAREGLEHIDLADTVAQALDRVQRFVTRIDQPSASTPSPNDNLTQ